MSSTDLITPLEATKLGPASGEAYSSFTYFPKLPTELRLKIFGYMMDELRTVKIVLMKGGNPYFPHTCRLRSQAEELPVLFLCKESRNEALRAYSKWQQVFSDPVSNLRINLEADTLFFDNHSALKVFLARVHPKALDLIQSLMVAKNVLSPMAIGVGRLTAKISLGYMAKFRNLKHLTLCVDAFPSPYNRDNPVRQEERLRELGVELEGAFKALQASDLLWNYPSSAIEVRHRD